MKKNLVVCLLVLTILLTGCDNKKINNIESCENCVFAYYDVQRQYGIEGNLLEEYTKDYTTLKADGVQINKFLGHILDENGVIVRGFACGINKGQPFCLEGSIDDSLYEQNKEVLKKVYDEDKCVDAETSFQCNDELYVIIYKTGNVLIDKDKPCFIADTRMFCW